jgi:hypothetical protein
MQFNSFVAVDVSSTPIGIDVPSKRNWAGTSFRAEITPDLKKTFLPTANRANFTVKYPGSTVRDFNLEEMYFGCIGATTLGAASVPVPCSARLTALDANDVELAEKFVTFAPSGLRVKMAFIEFKGAFDRVVTVKIALDSSTFVDKAITAMGFDDMKVVFHYK